MRTAVVLALLFAIVAVALGSSNDNKKTTTTTTTKKTTTTTTTKKPTTTTTTTPQPSIFNSYNWNLDYFWGGSSVADNNNRFTSSGYFIGTEWLNKLCASSNSNNLLSGLTSLFCSRWTSFSSQVQTVVQQEFAKYSCALPTAWSQIVTSA